MTCCPALENTRPALRAGIGDAERELEECRVRCEELEAMIARARVLLSEGMRAPFLAAEINRTR